MGFTLKSTLMMISILASALSPSFALADCKSDRLRISAGGDVIIHGANYQAALQSPEKFYSLFHKLKPLVDAADISYLNLEGPVANGITADGNDIGDQGLYYDCARAFCGTDFVFNYHPRLVGDLQRLGIDIVSTANNHSLDRGAIGIDRSVQALKDYNMRFTGTRSSAGGGYHSSTSAKGWKIAWIGCTEDLNGRSDRKSQILLCSSSEVTELIARFASDNNYDAVVVTPHWGDEYQQEPSSSQKSRAAKFAEAGATLIIGNHPHVVQRMNVLTTDSGRKVPVVYSLGNFMASQESIPKNLSAVFYFDSVKNRDGHTVVDRMSYVPTFLNANIKRGGYIFDLAPIDQLGQLTFFKKSGGEITLTAASTEAGTGLLADLLSKADPLSSRNLPSQLARTGSSCR